MIYLSGPIDLVTSEEAHHWRDQAKETIKMMDLNAEVFDPTDYLADWAGAFDARRAEVCVTFDKAKIAESSVILMNANRPGWGTGMETFYANAIGVPVVAWISADHIRCASPWLIYHCHEIHRSMLEAIGAVVSIDKEARKK